MRGLIFETRTGRPVVDVELNSWKYDTGVLAIDKATLSIPAYTPRSSTMDLRGLLTPRKNGIALVDDDGDGERLVPMAGAIEEVVAEQDDDGRDTWSVTTYGPQQLLKFAARVRKHPGWPLINAQGFPTGTYDMVLNGLEYGTIMKRLIQEAEKFPGGDLPIVFEDDRAGTRERTYKAIDGLSVLEAIDNLADLVGGVEYDFQPYITTEDWVRWRFVTATDAVRTVPGSGAQHNWNLGGRLQDIRGWKRRMVAGAAVTDAYFTGGKEEDQVLIARASSPTLIDLGWPRAEVWDNSHSTVSRIATLQNWANGALRGAQESAEFQVRATVGYKLRHGDPAMITANDHWDMRDGDTNWRVLSVGRSSSDPDWFDVGVIR